MKARVLQSFFTDKVSGTADTIIEINNQATFDDLLKAGYIEAVDTPPEAKKTRATKVADSE